MDKKKNKNLKNKILNICKILPKRAYIFFLLIILILSFLVHKVYDGYNKEELNYYIIHARTSLNNLEYTEAGSYYGDAYKYYPNIRELLEEYLVFTVMHDKPKQSLELANQIVKYNKYHVLSNLVLVVNAFAENDLEQVKALIDGFVAENQNNNEVFQLLQKVTDILFYSNKEDSKNLDKALLELKELSPSIYDYLSMVTILKKDRANAMLKLNSMNNAEVNIDYVIMYSKLLYSEDNEAGIKYFLTYLDDGFFTDKQVKKILSGDLNISTQDIIAQVLYKIAELMPREVNYTYFYSDLLLISSLGLQLDKDNERLLLNLATFNSLLASYDISFSTYNKIPKYSYYYMVVFNDVVNLYKEVDRLDDLEDYIKDHLNNNADDIKALLEQGHILDQKEKYASAISNYSEALEISINNNSKIGSWLAYFFRGVAYDHNDNWELAEKDLLKAKEINQADPLLINYLAYSWINRDIHIKEATKLLKDAIVLDKNNPNLLDSYAWALFKQKNYKTALTFSLRSSELLPSDPEISSHLGDILWQGGYTKDAIIMWNKALNLYENKEDIQKIQAKLHGEMPSYLDKKVKIRVGSALAY